MEPPDRTVEEELKERVNHLDVEFTSRIVVLEQEVQQHDKELLVLAVCMFLSLGVGVATMALIEKGTK